MEEWIGQWWHRAVTRVAEPDRAHVQVTLEEMRRSIALLYRAGGGDAAVRVAPVADSRHGGPRGWLQRLAGSGIRVPLPVLDWETLALPAQVAVFDERELNHELYLWLAALAAVFEPTGDWIADNRAATARALQRFAGMRGRHQRLTQAHLAQRPSLTSLRAESIPWEAAVQAALRGNDHGPLFVAPAQVAPVWLWLTAGVGQGPSGAAGQSGDGAGERDLAAMHGRAVRRWIVGNFVGGSDRLAADIDADIDARDWRQVLWAISTRVDPARESAQNTDPAARQVRTEPPVHSSMATKPAPCTAKLAITGASTSATRGTATLPIRPACSWIASVPRCSDSASAFHGHIAHTRNGT